MKRRIIILMLTLFCISTPASAEYWPHDSSHAISCKENRPNCHILQMVMMGCFDYVETPDSLDERVLSVVLPKLCAVEEADFPHFCEEFSVSEEMIKKNYYAALANCLLSDIHLNPNPGGDETLVRRVLGLFLDPQSETDGDLQIESIRSELTDDLINRMADDLNLPYGFVFALLNAHAD